MSSDQEPMGYSDDDEMVVIPRMYISQPLEPDANLNMLREAFRAVAHFPDFEPSERARWLDLRKAVERYLEAR